MSDPQIGDRVRAVCGESVLVGTLRWETRDSVRVSVDVVGRDMYLNTRKWSVEVIDPPIPEWITQPGAMGFLPDGSFGLRCNSDRSVGEPWAVYRADGTVWKFRTDAQFAALHPVQAVPASEVEAAEKRGYANGRDDWHNANAEAERRGYDEGYTEGVREYGMTAGQATAEAERRGAQRVADAVEAVIERDVTMAVGVASVRWVEGYNAALENVKGFVRAAMGDER